MSIQIADLIATLRLDQTGYMAGMRAAETQANATAGRISGAAGGVKIALGAMGLAAAAAIGESVKQAANYQTLLTHIQSNTGMTNQEIAGMSDGIKKMASDTGAPLDRLATGFMTIHNYGFSSADSMTILQKAMESALSTGDDVAAVSNVMGVAMHEFGLKAADAGAAMNVFHLAAQESNATLGQFAEGSTKATNMAATLGVSLVDVTAAVSTLVQSGQTVRAASDGITSTMMGIIKPTDSARAAIASLTHETGVNLVADFSTAGLKSRGLANILGDVRLATQKLGGDTALQRKAMLDYAQTLDNAGITGDKFTAKMAAFGKSIHDPTAAVMSLFTNVRAFREVMLLTTTQADSFSKHLTDMAAAMSGKVDPTGKAFAAQQQTMAAQMDKLSETVKVLAINLGSVFLPILTSMLDRVVPVIGAISQWVQGHAQLTATLLAGIAVLGTLTGGIAALSVVLGPVAAVIGALSLPIIGVVAAVALLATAWQRDWGGIREIASSVLSFLQPALQQLHDAITFVRIAFQLGGWSFALEEALVQVRQMWGNFTAWVSGTAFPALKATFLREAPIVWQWLKDAAPPVLREAAALFVSLNQWILTTAVPALARVFVALNKQLWAWIQEATPPALAQLKIWGSQIAGWLGQTGIPLLAAQLAKAETALWHWVQAATPVALAHLKSWGSQLAGWLGSTGIPALAAALSRGETALWNWIKAATPPALAQLAAWGSQLGAWLKNTGLPTLGRTLAAGASALWGWIRNPAMPAILREMGALMARVGSWLRTDGLPQLGRILAAGASALWGWIQNPALPTALREIGRLATQLGSWLRTDGLPGIGRALAGVAHYLWDWIASAASDTFKTVGKWRDDLKGDLLLGLKGAKDWLLQAGKDLIQGLINGMGSLKDAAKNKAVELAGNLKDAVTGFFGIKSPSTVFHTIGVDLIQGLIDGINSLIPSVTVAAGTLGTNIVKALTSGILSSATLVAQAAAYLAEAPINAILTTFSMAAADGESKVFKEIGASIPKSLAAGMAGGMPAVGQEATDGGKAIAAALLLVGGEFAGAGKSFVHAMGEAMAKEGPYLYGEASTLGKGILRRMQESIGTGKGLQVGGDFSDDVGRGIVAEQPIVVSEAQALINAVALGAKAALGQALPTLVTVGKLLAGGLGTGIGDAIPAVVSAVQAAMNAVGIGAQAALGLKLPQIIATTGEDAIATAQDPMTTAAQSAGTKVANGFVQSFGATAQAGMAATSASLQQQAAALYTQVNSALGGPAGSPIGRSEFSQSDATQLALILQSGAGVSPNWRQNLAQSEEGRTLLGAIANGATVPQDILQALGLSAPAGRSAATSTTGISSSAAGIPFGTHGMTTILSAADAAAQHQQQTAALTTQTAQTQQLATTTATITTSQQDILTALKGQVQVGSDVQKQLSEATTAAALRDVRDQAHVKFLTDEQTALAANNMAQYAYLQGQDQALSLDYSLEASQLAQVTAAQNLNDAAQKTLATDQARLQTAQQQLETAQTALLTAQQNLDTLQQTQAGQDAITKVRQPYDAAHLAQTIALQKLTSDYNRANLSYTEQLQKARADHNTALVKQLTEQQQQTNDNYQAQKQDLTDQAQQANDVYQAQMQQLNDQQQAQAQAVALKKAQDAVAAAAKVAADRQAAVKSAELAVSSAQTAADKAAAAWQTAAAKKEAYDAKASDAANSMATTTAALIAKFAADQLAQIAQISAAQTAAYNLRLQQTQNLQAAATGGTTTNAGAAAGNTTVDPRTPGQYDTLAATGSTQNAGAIAASNAYWAAQGGRPTAVAYQGNAWRDADGSLAIDPANAAYYGGPIPPGGAKAAGAGTVSAPAGQVDAPVSSPQLPGTQSGGAGMQVTVNINSGAVSVSGGGGASGALAQQIATAVTAAIRQVIGTQLTSAAGANSQLPGAL